MVETRPAAEQALLVGVQLKRRSGAWTAEDSMDELAELARRAGAEVVGSIT
ncbi:MAG: GTPase HflX, partial [Chloroflexi bacterium]|nr:GTPase HflX [Chloroflexota bacterium]